MVLSPCNAAGVLAILFASVLSQSPITAAAPPACLSPNVRDVLFTAEDKLMRLRAQLSAIGASRVDGNRDNEIARDLYAPVAELHFSLGHFRDLSELGALSSEKRVTLRARQLIVRMLPYVRENIDYTLRVLRREAASVKGPVLAAEVKDAVQNVVDLDLGLTSCMFEIKSASPD